MISGAPGPTRARDDDDDDDDAAAAAAAAAAADDDDDDDDDARRRIRVIGWSLQTITAVVSTRNEGNLARRQAFSHVVDGISGVTRSSSSGESSVDVPRVSRRASCIAPGQARTLRARGHQRATLGPVLRRVLGARASPVSHGGDGGEVTMRSNTAA